MAGVRILLADTAFDELVGEPGAAVMTIMLTTVEACPAEVEVMEVNVWVDDSPGIVASEDGFPET